MSRVAPNRAATSSRPRLGRRGGRPPGQLVHELQVVDLESGRVAQHRVGRRQHALRPVGGPIGPGKNAAERLSATIRSASERYMLRLDSARPSGSRTVGTHDVDRDVEVADHPTDQGELLGVFLAEERDVRSGEGEQLGDDGEHPTEVAGPARAFEDVTEATGVHRDRGLSVGVDHVGRGREDQLDPFSLAQHEVGVEGARVAAEVFPAANCSGFKKIVTTTLSARVRATRTSSA